MTQQYNQDVSLRSQPNPEPGPFLARVVGFLDPTYMGGLEVELLRPVGNSPISGQVHQVYYMSPFYGVTSASYVVDDPDNSDDQDQYNNTQTSYGMWMIPPDYGTTVVVIFINGDPKRGYWIGCVQDYGMNFMVPGLAATENVAKGSGDSRVPVAEYNHKANTDLGNPTKFKKPKHPFAEVLTKSGLDKDDIRGTTTSSARRETPSMVFGISTPGPLDKDNGRTENVGKVDCPAKSHITRKGGSTFVMDDGDERFIRKKPATEDKPEYIDVVADGKGGATDYSIPHNELIRIRTRTGHQILLHNSEDLIYISHGSGNSWIEMTANGKIDVYAKDSISFHTENDFNFVAGRDINLQAGGAFNVIAKDNANIQGAKANLNTDGAAKAPVRIPDKEPWNGHENLDPQQFIPDKTKAGGEKPKDPEMFKKYTAPSDTFGKTYNKS